MKKHTIVMTVANRTGVMARISGLLCSRGYKIENLIQAPTEKHDVYKVHLVVCGQNARAEQATKQLNKLIDTIKVVDISHKKDHILREFLLVKVSAEKYRSEILELVRIFGAKVVDMTRLQLIIELSEHPLKIERFIDILRPYGIKEYVRSGSVALNQGEFQQKEIINDSENLLQQRLGHEPDKGKDRSHNRIRKPGACSSPEPSGQRL